LTELIQETKKRHRDEDFGIDSQLTLFSNQNPIRTFRQSAVYVKGIFKANFCPLQANVDNHWVARTAKISEGILKAIYDAQDSEKQDLIDYQAYAGERIGCLAGYTGNNPMLGTNGLTLNQIEPYDKRYSIIHILSHQNKARYTHICIIPKTLADRIKSNALNRGRTHPFPNYETLWREITQYALKNHGVRLTSHYLRKRFHTIAGTTKMPVNEWDFLMGDKMSAGHEANVYTLEDHSQLVADYDRYLAPRLGLGNADKDPLTDTPATSLAQENRDLKEQILKLTKLLTERLPAP